ncbi:MAG: FtsQ-type POTRA domain-containing protein [Treponema sp.]|nr:FtsQ-type POTRA domain-containing protein [Treponema sp.]
MLGDFIYSADINAGSASTEAVSCRYNTPRKLEKAVKRFLLMAVIVVSGGLLWFFAINPCMVPAKVDVKSFPGLDRAAVLSIAGIGGNAAYIAINAAETERRLSAYYLVESAKVVKRFPDRLSIYLEPRIPAAAVYARVNGRTQPVYFDRHGVAVGMGNETAGTVPSWLPVVSGVIEYNQPIRPGMRLSPAYLPLLSRIGSISDEDPKIWQAISEIGIAKKDNELYDLLLYPVHGSTRLRMRDSINKDDIYYALLMFDVCRQFGGSVPDEIDARSGIGVVSAKEARFGK